MLEGNDDNNGDNLGDAVGDPSTPKTEEQHVPYTRFKEVNDKMRDLEQEIGSLKQQKGDAGLTPEKQKELEAKQYLKNLLKETLNEQDNAKAQAEKAKLDNFRREVDDVLAINTDINRSEFTAFLEKEKDDYSSVASALKGFKRLQETAKESEDKVKANLDRKPKMPSNEGAGGSDFTPPDSDKGKSLWQIAQEATKELMRKK